MPPTFTDEPGPSAQRLATSTSAPVPKPKKSKKKKAKKSAATVEEPVSPIQSPSDGSQSLSGPEPDFDTRSDGSPAPETDSGTRWRDE